MYIALQLYLITLWNAERSVHSQPADLVTPITIARKLLS
jgi:hypothetical protein